jgi:nucleoside-diphosphate-sugar epimerase
MSKNSFLVTGAQGCIGSWVIKNLLEEGHDVTAFDIDDRPVRLSLLLSPKQLKKIRFAQGDINNLELIKRLIEQRSISHIVHLAGLMTPDCRARPILGATVNVLGTLTVFEAARAHRGQVRCVAYASSGAVMGLDEQYDSLPVKDGAPRIPATLYGVFKTTSEDCARIYWQDEGVRSVGLRPPVVYGPGRDRGLTAGVTLSVKAALLGEDCEIGFGGPANMEFVDDVAKGFVLCALKEPEGAPALNMLGEIVEVEEMIRIIKDLLPTSKSKITSLEKRNAMVNRVDDSGIQALIGPFPRTPFREGVRLTADFFRRLLMEGRLQ